MTIYGVVAIGLGVVPLEEWRQAATVADAVSDFCAAHQTPRAPADYLGIDPGWSAVQWAAEGYVWAWDFDLSLLVQVLAVP